MSRASSVSLISFVLALGILLNLTPSSALAEPYPQIKLFHHTPDCNWVPNSSLSKKSQDEKKGGRWLNTTNILGGVVDTKECKEPVTAVDKANAWLKKNGNSILILGYQYNGNIITILWKDKPKADKDKKDAFEL